MGIINSIFGKPKKAPSAVKQSYWKKTVSKVPIWKQKNDDDKIGKPTEDEMIERIKDSGSKVNKSVAKYHKEMKEWADSQED